MSNCSWMAASRSRDRLEAGSVTKESFSRDDETRVKSIAEKYMCYLKDTQTSFLERKEQFRELAQLWDQEQQTLFQRGLTTFEVNKALRPLELVFSAYFYQLQTYVARSRRRL